jgi:type II secretory pathway pseudopilin PulG
MTLLEVVIALAIFLFSLTAIAQLLSFSRDRVVDGHLRSQANLRCEAKLAEVLTGAESLSSASGSFSDDPNWSWRLNCSEQGSVPNLWSVEVTVEKKKGTGTVAVSLSQMMFAPNLRGSTLVDLGNVTDGPNPSTAQAPKGSSGGGGGAGGAGAGGAAKGGGTAAKGGAAKGGGTPTKGGAMGGTGAKGGTGNRGGGNPGAGNRGGGNPGGNRGGGGAGNPGAGNRGAAGGGKGG